MAKKKLSSAAAALGRRGGKSRSHAKLAALKKNRELAHAARRKQRDPNGPSALAEKLGISRQAAAKRIAKNLVDK